MHRCFSDWQLWYRKKKQKLADFVQESFVPTCQESMNHNLMMRDAFCASLDLCNSVLIGAEVPFLFLKGIVIAVYKVCYIYYSSFLNFSFKILWNACKSIFLLKRKIFFVCFSYSWFHRPCSFTCISVFLCLIKKFIFPCLFTDILFSLLI